jgi:hypothetical protein
MKMPIRREPVEEMALVVGYNLAYVRDNIHSFAKHVEDGTLHDQALPYGANGETVYHHSESALHDLESTIIRMQVYAASLPKPTRSNRYGHR